MKTKTVIFSLLIGMAVVAIALAINMFIQNQYRIWGNLLHSNSVEVEILSQGQFTHSNTSFTFYMVDRYSSEIDQYIEDEYIKLHFYKDGLPVTTVQVYLLSRALESSDGEKLHFMIRTKPCIAVIWDEYCVLDIPEDILEKLN